jgi:probable rRNA maturation factor
MRTVELSSENVEPPHWLPDLSGTASEVYGHLRLNAWDVSVLLCDENRIAELNEQYRKTDGPTDVLTFLQDDFPQDSHEVAGDIVISLPTVEQNADEYGVSVTEEFLRVYVHALLHLAGYTHDGVDLSSPGAAEHPMLGLQEILVARLYKELDS